MYICLLSSIYNSAICTNYICACMQNNHDSRDHHNSIVLGGDLGFVSPEVIEKSVWIRDDGDLIGYGPCDHLHQCNTYIQHTESLESNYCKTH